MFEGVRGSSSVGDIAIDDVQLIDGLCASPATCDFERPGCTWSNTVVGDDFDWIRSQGMTGTYGTGPTNDHTLNNAQGQFMSVFNEKINVSG